MTYFRWKMIALAFMAVIITYLDRSALSYALVPLQAEYGFTDTDFGLIASAFGVGYMIMTVIGGVLVDRFGARKIWSLFSVFWSLSCAALAFAGGFAGFFCLRLMLGISEGPSFPALTRVSADWLPLSERARSLAVGLAAVPFASVIGAPLVSYLVTAFGWRLMFVILGSFGLVWALIWVLLFRDKPKEIKNISVAELSLIENGLETTKTRSRRTSWRFILFNRSLLVNNYAFFAFGYLLFFAITWLPGYLEQTYAIQVRQTGWFLIAPWITATLLLLLGGFLSDVIWRKTKSIRLARSYLIWICQALSAFCFLPLLFYPSLPIAMLAITFGIGFGMMPNAAFYALNADLAHDRAATSLGVMDGGFALAGILAPFLTGWLANLTGNFKAAFGILILLTFTSALAIILWQHPDKN
jgi:ACS family hexuronate transporter-like MFS transporter